MKASSVATAALALAGVLNFGTALGVRHGKQGDQMPPPPVPLGKMAPNFSVSRLDGSKVKLSSLRGKIVMVDFWATWCPPCRKGLPVTDKISQLYSKKGLVVLAISDEDRKTVADFIKTNGYKMPTYYGAGATQKKYGIAAIPTMVIIDAKGRLSSYSVGLEPESTVMANLRKAGLKP
jgi:thiol-disulfide isomerase/thioredoxin